MRRNSRQFLQGMMLISGFSLVDQWKKPVEWKEFDKIPTVLVFGGKNASGEAKKWCNFLAKEFNPKYSPSKNHLQKIFSDEKIKVVEVIAIPPAPRLLRGILFSGFQKEFPNWGVAMDFGSEMSKAFEYDFKNMEPLIVVIGKKSYERVQGKISDQKTKELLLQQIKATL